MTDSVARLYDAVIAVRNGDPTKSRTARLFRAGRSKMAKKLAEEAVEVVIDAMHGQPEAVIRESADLMYNLVVLWVAAGIRPACVVATIGTTSSTAVDPLRAIGGLCLYRTSCAMHLLPS